MPSTPRTASVSMLRSPNTSQLKKLAEETPEANLNLGILHAAMKNTDKARSAYRKALEIEPRFVPAIVNLADLYRELGQDEEGAKVLQQGI